MAVQHIVSINQVDVDMFLQNVIMSVQNLKVIHSVVAEILQAGENDTANLRKTLV